MNEEKAHYDEHGYPLPKHPGEIVACPDSFFWNFAPMPEERMKANIRSKPGTVCYVGDGDNPGLYVKGLTKWNLVPGTGE
jgi:hypothetical protein